MEKIKIMLWKWFFPAKYVHWLAEQLQAEYDPKEDVYD